MPHALSHCEGASVSNSLGVVLFVRLFFEGGGWFRVSANNASKDVSDDSA